MLARMDPWITLNELAVWARRPIAPGDEFAAAVLEASTLVVSWATGYHGTTQQFTSATAPDRLKVIVAQVAKRNYLNPDQVTREGNVGPLGGDTYAEAFAAGMALTETEEAEIAKIARLAVEGSAASSTGDFGVLRIIPAHHAGRPSHGVFLPDASGSDWMIPVEG